MFHLKYVFVSSYYVLTWEPRVAQGTHNYSRRLPALGRKLKVDPLNLQSKNILQVPRKKM